MRNDNNEFICPVVGADATIKNINFGRERDRANYERSITRLERLESVDCGITRAMRHDRIDGIYTTTDGPAPSYTINTRYERY